MIVCSWLLVAVVEVLPSVFSPPPTTTICSRSRCELPRERWQRRQVCARAQTAAAPVLPKRRVQAVVVVVGYSSLFIQLFVVVFCPFSLNLFCFVVVAALYANLQLFFCLLLLMLFVAFLYRVALTNFTYTLNII